MKRVKHPDRGGERLERARKDERTQLHDGDRIEDVPDLVIMGEGASRLLREDLSERD